MKATARAHPIQGLIKYHGLADFETRTPLHASISACVAPLATTTTVQRGHDEDEIIIDGVSVQGRALKRAQDVLGLVRDRAGADEGVRVESSSSFPQGVGLGSSSSGFAALAMAAQAAFDLDLPLDDIADIAQRGAGSATRAVHGGIAEWRVHGEDTANQLAGPRELDWTVLMALVDHQEFTENVHRDVMGSPLLDARVSYIEGALEAMRDAVEYEEREAIFELAEKDTLNLHAVTMTGERGRITWQPATVAVMRAVWDLRDAGVPVWFSIDTGATVYVNTLPEHEERVTDRLIQIEGVQEVLRGSIGGATRLLKEHLF